MALYLVQHGKNLPKDVDPDKGLSDDGAADVRRIADAAKGYTVKVDAIAHSGKKRALQTAEIFAEALSPARGVSEREGLGALDDVAAAAKNLKSEENLMLVGHLPFMEKMTGCLTAGDAEKRVFKFQNGGIVCLDADPDGDGWVVKWALMPQIG
jgi:phosphohistidine phosphatase